MTESCTTDAKANKTDVIVDKTCSQWKNLPKDRMIGNADFLYSFWSLSEIGCTKNEEEKFEIC